MSQRATLIVLGIVAATVVFATPELMLRSASATLAGLPCGTPVAPRPPADGYYKAIERLDSLTLIPWTSARATDRTTSAALECLGSYTTLCDGYRDAAVESARAVVAERMIGSGSGSEVAESRVDWRAHLDDDVTAQFCDEWSSWRAWLAAEGQDASGACAVCAR